MRKAKIASVGCGWVAKTLASADNRGIDEKRGPGLRSRL